MPITFIFGMHLQKNVHNKEKKKITVQMGSGFCVYKNFRDELV